MGFSQIGEVIDQRMAYRADAAAATGQGAAVYVFVNPNGDVWKVGKTAHGFARVDYTRVLDGRSMRRPHEQRKLQLIRDELSDGATQWVLPTEEADLLEDILIVLLNPSESSRSRSRREQTIRKATRL